MVFIKKCDKLQRHSNLHHAPIELLHSRRHPNHFTSKVDILRPFHVAFVQLDFLIVELDYFTKWICFEDVSKITIVSVFRFYWQKIMCRFSLLETILPDNGTQFASTTIIEFFKDMRVQTKFVSVVHPHVNRKVESTNKVILKRIKKKLDDAKLLWDEQMHRVLWSYHTTPILPLGRPFYTSVLGGHMLPVKIDTPLWRHS